MKRNILKALMMPLLLCGLGVLWAQQDTEQSSPPADNTKVNQRDRNQSEPTPGSQKEGSGDRQLVQQIRRALVNDKSLSTNAHNIKVIAKNVVVTLKGPVDSDTGKQAVEAKAAQVAGADRVNSEIYGRGVAMLPPTPTEKAR